MPEEPRPVVLSPEALNGTNRMELFVFGNDATGQALLVARADNLGKGASGSAAQNIDCLLYTSSGGGADALCRRWLDRAAEKIVELLAIVPLLLRRHPCDATRRHSGAAQFGKACLLYTSRCV